MRLYTQVTDGDTSTRAPDDIVDTFTIDIAADTIPGTHVMLSAVPGQHGLGVLSLNISLTCAQNYFGSDCSVFCQERNDSTVHYTCDSEGNIVCIEGYQDPFINCTQCIPQHEGCCKFTLTDV